MTAKPVFIVMEGADGCGKNTVGKLLAGKLDAECLETPPAEISAQRKEIDALYKGRDLALQLFYASFVAFASERAKEILGRGRSVVVVRYWASTVAYNGIVRKCKMDDSAWLAHVAVPHFTCLLEVPLETRRARMKKRGEVNETDQRSLEEAACLDKRYRRVLVKHKTHAGRILRVPNNDSAEECAARILREMENPAD